MIKEMDIVSISVYLDELLTMLETGVESMNVPYLHRDDLFIDIIQIVELLLVIQAEGYENITFTIEEHNGKDAIMISPVKKVEYFKYIVDKDQICLN